MVVVTVGGGIVTRWGDWVEVRLRGVASGRLRLRGVVTKVGSGTRRDYKVWLRGANAYARRTRGCEVRLQGVAQVEVQRIWYRCGYEARLPLGGTKRWGS